MSSKLLRTTCGGLLILLALVGLYTLTVPDDASAQTRTFTLTNTVVLCSSCAYKGMPQEGHLVLMDGRSGEIWAYSDSAMAGSAAPTFVGTMTALGEPIVKNR